MKHTIAISADVRSVLELSTITESSLKLPPGQLERRLYERVDKVLRAAGGKWDRKTLAHVFSQDPRIALGLALETGGILDTKKAKQQFFTPAALAARIAIRAGIRPGMRVLEPSAGAGALAREARVLGGEVDCIELDPDLAARLRADGFSVRVTNFMHVEPTRSYDRVVMNPPFENGQDIDHVSRAFTFLMLHGVLVSVMGAGATTGSTRRHKTFQGLLARYGEVETIPDGSFEESGTGVRTVLVVLRA